MRVSVFARERLAELNAWAHARGVSLIVVGGALRDTLLGRRETLSNIDLAVAREALRVAREAAEALGAAFVPLDEAFGTARLVFTAPEGERLEIDLAEFRGASLDEDLRGRDFTVNALALPLEAWLRDPDGLAGLIDPLGGREALVRRELAACGPAAFTEDPLRVLRAVRFSAQLALSFAPGLEALMAPSVAALAGVSGERVRDELLRVFATDRAGDAVEALNRLRAFDILLPEMIPGRDMAQGGFHHLDVLGHQLEAVRQSDRILADFREFSEPLRGPLAAYCAQEVVPHRSRKSLIKLGCLLHDIGKPEKRGLHEDGDVWFLGHEHAGAELTAPIVRRLKLSNREGEMVCALVRHHLRPGFLSREPELTRRALYRFYQDLGEDGPACLLTWWSDRMATRGPRSRLDQLDQQRQRLEAMLTPYFFKPEEVVRPLRLIDGHRLMAELALSPGPQVGALLSAIEEAQAEGRVHSADEALALARELSRGQVA